MIVIDIPSVFGAIASCTGNKEGDFVIGNSVLYTLSS